MSKGIGEPSRRLSFYRLQHDFPLPRSRDALTVSLSKQILFILVALFGFGQACIGLASLEKEHPLQAGPTHTEQNVVRKISNRVGIIALQVMGAIWPLCFGV